MHLDPEGKKILGELLIDSFIPLQEEWYDPVRRMHEKLVQMKEGVHGVQKP
jgi:hypothetical protein